MICLTSAKAQAFERFHCYRQAYVMIIAILHIVYFCFRFLFIVYFCMHVFFFIRYYHYLVNKDVYIHRGASRVVNESCIKCVQMSLLTLWALQLREFRMIGRLTDSSYAVARHAAYARQRSAPVLLRLLHIRYHRSPAVVWIAAKPLLSRAARQPLSRRSVSPITPARLS